MIKYKKKESLRIGEIMGYSSKDDDKVFKNPLEADLTIIGSLRHMFISHCDTTALT